MTNFHFGTNAGNSTSFCDSKLYEFGGNLCCLDDDDSSTDSASSSFRLAAEEINWIF